MSSPDSPPAGTIEIAIKVLNDGVVDRKLNYNKLLSGDIVLQVDIYGRPFLGGKQALFDFLHRLHESHKSKVSITVERGKHKLTREVFIVPERNHGYVLVDYYNTSHVFTFEHYTREECKHLQYQAQKYIHEQLLDMQVASADVDYLWQEHLSTSFERLNMVYSILVLPHMTFTVSRLSNPEETVNRAMTWFIASERSGVPLTLRNIQTEPLLTEASEQGSDIDLSSIGNTGSYGFHQSRGTADHFIVNAARLWFEFKFAEVEVELVAGQDEPRLGVSIHSTKEGFCYVKNVDENTAADRAGLKRLLETAEAQKMILVVTRVGNDKVLPWCIAKDTIKCYDVSSIIGMLKAYHQAHMPACLHILNIKSPTSISS